MSLLLQRDIDEPVCAGGASGSRSWVELLRVAQRISVGRVLPFGE